MYCQRMRVTPLIMVDVIKVVEEKERISLVGKIEESYIHLESEWKPDATGLSEKSIHIREKSLSGMVAKHVTGPVSRMGSILGFFGLTVAPHSGTGLEPPLI